jgi:hypothetical protein
MARYVIPFLHICLKAESPVPSLRIRRVCTVANDEQDKQPPSPASTLNSQPVVTTTPTAAAAAASAAAVTPAEPEPVKRADGSDKYYGMENVNIPHPPRSQVWAITDQFSLVWQHLVDNNLKNGLELTLCV